MTPTGRLDDDMRVIKGLPNPLGDKRLDPEK
jgi:hypothetical protein